MKFTFPSSAALFRWLTGFAGLLLLVAITLVVRPQRLDILPSLVVSLFVAFQVYFSLEIFRNEFILISGIVLGSALLFGPGVAGWGSLLGMVLWLAIRKTLPGYRPPGRPAF